MSEKAFSLLRLESAVFFLGWGMGLSLGSQVIHTSLFLLYNLSAMTDASVSWFLWVTLIALIRHTYVA